MKTMNDNELRVKIAEACGWIDCHPVEGSVDFPPYVEGRDPIKGWMTDTPDYLGSLDAMHEAEKMLTARQWSEYATKVEKLSLKEAPPIWKELNPSRIIDFALIHATARQRALAFVQTITQP